MNGLVLVGANGLAREATALAVRGGHTGPIAVLDDDGEKWGSLHGLHPVLGGSDLVVDMVDHDAVLTLGHGRIRRRVAARLRVLGVEDHRYATLIHPWVAVPGGCSVGVGSIVLDGVVLTADVTIGRHVVVMPHVTLTHGCVVEDFATLCSGVSLGGDVHVGTSAYVGMNASVREGVSIGAGATLGMGAVLLEDLPAGETWVGNPARPLRIGALT